jgi:hypothetical protein
MAATTGEATTVAAAAGTTNGAAGRPRAPVESAAGAKWQRNRGILSEQGVDRYTTFAPKGAPEHDPLANRIVAGGPG